MTLLDQALAVAATGVPVFPCSIENTPVCAGGFKAATTNPGRIRSLFAHSAAHRIGMPTGATSGLIVVDIDPRHDGNAWLDENRAAIGTTRTHGTRSGGVHLVFNDGGHEIRNSAGKVKDGRKQGIASGVDVRGNGGYVVIPPSPGYTVADPAPIADMPGWLVALCRKPAEDASTVAAASPIRPWAARAPQDSDASHYGRVALESAADEIRHAVDGSKHEIINRVGYSIGGLVAAGEILEGDAFRALSDALAEIRGQCKNFRAAQQTLSRSFNEGKGRPRDVPDRPEPIADAVHPAQGLLDQIGVAKAAIQRAAGADPLPVGADLMDVGGALGMFVDYCGATAISPQPFLALAAGITAIGVLAGRKYRTRTNLRSNVYAVGIADSGGGKDHARGAVKDVFFAAGVTEYMGGEDIASGTAIITALNRHPAMLFQIDEFGDFLNDVLGPKAASHKKQISQRLKTLYSSAKSFMPGVEYADQSKAGKPRADLMQPHACLYGTTTPAQFWRAIATASLEDGLLARFFIFVSPNSYPDRQKPAFYDPPARLVDAFKAIAAGPPGRGDLAGVMVSTIGVDAYTVPMTPEAEAGYDALDLHVLERQRKHAGTYVTAIAGRLVENATKLALIRAVSRDPAAPVITGADMAWGRAIAEHCVETLLRDVGDNIAETPFQANCNKAAALVRKMGTCTMREMQRKGFVLNKRDAAEVMDFLVSSGTVYVEDQKQEGSGRPTVRYSIGAR